MPQFRRFFSAQPNLFELVSKLRNQTSISMNLCRKAALESNLDYKIALEILSKASAKSFKKDDVSDVTNFGKEGLIGIMGSAKRKCLIELRCDSDFVVQNSEFINISDAIMSAIINSNAKNFSELLLPNPFNITVNEAINVYRSKFRENIGLESVKIVETDPSKFQVIGYYLHQKLGPNSGKIGALLQLEVENKNHVNGLEEVGNMLARQMVGLSDPEINISKLLNSDYLFSSIGTVRKFIEYFESKFSSKITVIDVNYMRIK